MTFKKANSHHRVQLPRVDYHEYAISSAYISLLIGHLPDPCPYSALTVMTHRIPLRDDPLKKCMGWYPVGHNTPESASTYARSLVGFTALGE